VAVLRSGWIRLFFAAALPLAIAAAWMPLRDRLPNTDLALLLILIIAMVGWLIGPWAALTAALVAAVAFDVIDARPYGTLTMSRAEDTITAVILLVTGLLVGAGAARLARYRKAANERSDALAVVMEASRLVATGEERQLITEALGAELQRALHLEACEFRAEPPDGARLSVARDGSLVGLVASDGRDAAAPIDLPVWCQGEVVAHYRLTPGRHLPTKDELRVALSLADQAGAAMAAGSLSPPPSPTRPARLRLLPSGDASRPGGTESTPTRVAHPASHRKPPAGGAPGGRRAAAL
jgi:hypothetical protein